MSKRLLRLERFLDSLHEALDNEDLSIFLNGTQELAEAETLEQLRAAGHLEAFQSVGATLLHQMNRLVEMERNWEKSQPLHLRPSQMSGS